MNRIFVLFPLLAISAAAQDAGQEQLKFQVQQLEKLKAREIATINAAVMGPSVKGAPYSGLETVENTQTLGDGTHINQTTQTMVYRDSEGRVRRETPDSITIWDPVAKASYVLDPKSQTARKMPLGMTVVKARAEAGGQLTRFEYRSGGVNAGGPGVTISSDDRPIALAPVETTAAFMPGLLATERLEVKSDSLGQQVMSGVNATGMRMTSTIEAGKIGNDRPIQIVTERWYSPELQTDVKTVHSDPRSGQETFELTNIIRAEPSPDLFQVPPGYQMVGRP